MTKYILVASCFALFTLSFSCDLFTGPHKGGGADTTSHAWTFEIDTLGDGGGSTLYDVDIVSTNPPLAYVLGEINAKDSTGNWANPPYNLARWDGNHWSLQRVLYSYQGQLFYQLLQCIYVLNANDIWVAGNGVEHWDGSQFKNVDLPIAIWGQGRVNKIWGTSSSDLYIVGEGGSIARWGGSGWTKLAIGTTLDIRDIWGSSDGSQILAIASSLNTPEKKVLSIHGTTVTTLSDSGLPWDIYGLWFSPNKKYYIAGGGIFSKNQLNDPVWNNSQNVISYEAGGIRGNDTNDVFEVGSFCEITHYNGKSWHDYKDEIPIADGALGRVAVKDNLMIAVGFAGSSDQKAIAIVGRRK